MNDRITQVNIGQIKLIFGRHAVKQICGELDKLQVKKPLIVTDKMLLRIGLLDPVLEQLTKERVPYVIYDKIQPDPRGSEVDNGVSFLKENACDGVVGFGGGSVMDSAKCIAAMATNSGVLMDYDHSNKNYKEFDRASLPLINIPTTSGTGSEMSPYAVITNEQEGRKATIGSPSLLSRVAIADPLLVLNLPKSVTAATGADALTHNIEAFTTAKAMDKANPIIDSLALTGIKYLYENLLMAYENGSDCDVREKVMWGSVIGGFVLQFGSGASHGLGNVLGGEYHIPHGNAVGMLLPRVMEFNKDVCGERYGVIADYLGIVGSSAEEKVDTMIQNIARIFQNMQMPSLSEYVKDPNDLPRLAELAMKDKCTKINGKPVQVEDAENLYRSAY